MNNIKKLSKKAIIAISAVLAVIVAVLVAGGIYSVVTEQTPGEAVKSIITSDEEKIIGKWQSQDNPGLSAYIFYDDGRYDSYISTVNFSGRYTIKGNELTITNPSTNKDIVFKYTVNNKELTLSVIEEDGEAPDEPEVRKYDRVDELNQKSVADLLGEIAKKNQDATETANEAE
ncbi:MAG: hypothetical protein J1E81_06505 [Eubacterium sp.]|nr:hypothetical protein [Eubacterium sp.]